MITDDRLEEIRQELREEMREEHGKELNERLSAACNEMVEDAVQQFKDDLSEAWDGFFEYTGDVMTTAVYFNADEWETKKREVVEEVKQEREEEFSRRFAAALRHAEQEQTA